MPKVSIIVPVYNAEAFVGECVESVLAQSFADWELLLIDDGSRDGSAGICRSFADADSRVTLVEKPNGGVSSARNAGLELASGDYVFFLDADDELYPYSLEVLMATVLEERVEIAIGRSISGVTKSIGPGTRKSVRAVSRKAPKSVTRIISPYEACMDILYRKPHPDTSVCGRLISLSLFEDIRFYPGRYEDLEIFHKLVMKTRRIAVTDTVVYFYRDNPSSFINTWNEGSRDAVKVTQMIVVHYADDPQLWRAARNRQFRANYNLLLSLFRYRPDDREAIESCFRIIKEERREVITDSRSRFSTRIGALLSYPGLGFMKWMARIIKVY